MVRFIKKVCASLFMLGLALYVDVSGLSGGGHAPLEADSAALLKEEPHPRRYWVIFRELVNPGQETVDLGVYDPLRKTPQYDPRIPY